MPKTERNELQGVAACRNSRAEFYDSVTRVKDEDEKVLYNAQCLIWRSKSTTRMFSEICTCVGEWCENERTELSDVCESEENASEHHSEMSTRSTKGRGRVCRPVVKSTIREHLFRVKAQPFAVASPEVGTGHFSVRVETCFGR